PDSSAPFFASTPTSCSSIGIGACSTGTSSTQHPTYRSSSGAPVCASSASTTLSKTASTAACGTLPTQENTCACFTAPRTSSSTKVRDVPPLWEIRQLSPQPCTDSRRK